MPFAYRAGWMIALALIAICCGLAQTPSRKAGHRQGRASRYVLILVGLALLAYAINGCAPTDAFS